MGGKNLTPRILKLIQKAGYQFVRSGKHQTWMDPKTGMKLTVPHACKSKHTANAILKTAGVTDFKF